MSGDYGFGHAWTTFWFCIGKVEPSLAAEILGIDTPWALDVIILYRELIPETRSSEDAVARLIVKATPVAERKEIVRFVMGSDVNKTPRFSDHSIVEMIESVTVPAGLPKIHNANCGPGTRVVNARVLWEMLRRTVSMRSGSAPQEAPNEKTYPLILFSAECPRACSAIPSLIADEDNPEDVLKIDGEADDIFDGIKYGTAEHASVRSLAPVEVRRKEYIETATTRQGEYMNQLRFDHQEIQRVRRARRR